MRPRNGEADVRAVAEGTTIPFSEYLARVAPKRVRPVIWRARDLEERLDATAPTERGTVALIAPNAGDAVAVAPGLSCVIQVIPPQRKTGVHAHSFWHLCLIRSGSGAVSIGDDDAEDRLSEGDTLFIPAWCPHAFSNGGGAPLVIMVIQNLPDLAEAGTVARQDAGEAIRVVYGDTSRADPAAGCSDVWRGVSAATAAARPASVTRSASSGGGAMAVQEGGGQLIETGKEP